MNRTFDLKTISSGSVPAALEKAERYRLLNEPHEAESICLDILAVDPDHRPALVTLVLALSDQLAEDPSRFEVAMQAAARLDGYERFYYEGLLWERRAKAFHRGGLPLAGAMAYDAYHRAMELYEKAAAAPGRPAANEDAILRWNACARVLMRHPDLAPPSEEPSRFFGE